jgi:glycosyltransferase involved in cell wall biosynthesis
MNRLNRIEEIFDSIVMLTFSNWKTELRSNRYHYASRFSKLFPVIFVQPDLVEETFSYELTELENVWILHVYGNYDSQSQVSLITKALNAKGIITPLIWLYNPYFKNYFTQAYSPYKIYHATEDYYSSDYPNKLSSDFVFYLNNVIDTANEVICVSPGVKNSIVDQNIKWNNKIRTITNGCDYEFYAVSADHDQKIKNKIAFYQGNIFDKIDFELLSVIAKKMPDWTFQFCGPIVNSPDNWNNFKNKHSNVEYLGVLTPEQLRIYLQNAMVGIIPFRKTPYLINSFPLKAFEYIASGLPVVSISIEALKNFEDVFLFADDADQFIEQLLVAETRSKDAAFIKKSMEIAKNQSYTIKFENLLKEIIKKINQRECTSQDKLNILILYEFKSIKINTIKDHVESFGLFSRHTISYATASPDRNTVKDLSNYDAVVIHYSLRLSLESGAWTLSPKVRDLLKGYPGLKVAFIQDEYDTTNVAINWLKDLGIHLLFTCVPQKYQRVVYPQNEIPFIRFTLNLTGYVPEALRDYHCKPMSKRKTTIAYRGRSLPFWYGDLGQEKEFIGKKMKEFCLAKGINEDIEYDDSKRIYGNAWYEFLASSKTTLGTESGSNIFDYGHLCRDVRAYLEQKPNASYEEVFKLFLHPHEGKVRMNQISPKIFEAICLHTALILFEGEYSGVLEAGKHYISLKKDFSNIDEVLMKANDNNYLTGLTEHAYRDIVLSNNYSYQSFVTLFDNAIDSFMIKKRKSQPVKLKFKKQILTFIKPLTPLFIKKTLKRILFRNI